jgi:hypothetical protein
MLRLWHQEGDAPIDDYIDSAALSPRLTEHDAPALGRRRDGAIVTRAGSARYPVMEQRL